MNPTIQHSDRAQEISLPFVFRTLSAYRRQIFRNMLIALLCAAVAMLFLPRRYHSSTQMLFEENSYVASGLVSTSARMGVNIVKAHSEYDAYFPPQYQEFLFDNRLIGHLLFTEVTTVDGRKMTYAEYLRKHNTPLNPADKNLLRPTKTLDSLIIAARKQLKMRGNGMDGTLFVDASADDPRVCQQVCQSLSDYLFRFIRDYRIKKQQTEVTHFAQLAQEQKDKYEAAKKALADFADSHWGTLLPSEEKMKEQLSEEVINTKHIYDNVKVEYNMSAAQLRDITPAYIVIEHPAIPTKLSGLSRTFFCVLSVLLALLYSLLYYMRNELWTQIVR